MRASAAWSSTSGCRCPTASAAPPSIECRGGTVGDYAEARLRATKPSPAFESIGNRGGRATATLNLLRSAKMEPAEAEALLARSIEDARAAGDTKLEASALHSWGDGLFSSGQDQDAFAKLERAATLYEEIGDRLNLWHGFQQYRPGVSRARSTRRGAAVSAQGPRSPSGR